ncbi:hypothetical protein HOD29_02250 [archaeon]|jgi:hypothetical protein|nr:hypothetical protein [archaeon]
MKTIHDYEEPIKKILEKDFDVSRYEVHEEGLQFDLEYGIHKMNSVLDVDWKNTFNGIYEIQGNDFLGYHLNVFGFAINYDGSPRKEDSGFLEKLIDTNEKIARELDFDSLTVQTRWDIITEIYKKKEYLFEPGENPIGFKKLK